LRRRRESGGRKTAFEHPTSPASECGWEKWLQALPIEAGSIESLTLHFDSAGLKQPLKLGLELSTHWRVK
jgi:hypothetical protein